MIIEDIASISPVFADEDSFLEVGFTIFHSRVGQVVNEKLIPVAIVDHLDELVLLLAGKSAIAKDGRVFVLAD